MHSRPCPDRFKAAVDYTSKSLISICTHINNGGFDGTYPFARSNGVWSPRPRTAENLGFADRAWRLEQYHLFAPTPKSAHKSPRFSQRNNTESILKTEQRHSNVFQRQSHVFEKAMRYEAHSTVIMKDMDD
jgi:hypothetical protein